jgi:hypothetical protein
MLDACLHHLQGTSIELIITYLRKWLRIERTHVGRLLWSYPLDYSLPRLVMPLDMTATSTAEESVDTDSTVSGPAAASTGTAAAASDDSSSSAGDEQQQQQQAQEPQQRSGPLWGSPAACSWLDYNAIKNGSSGSSSSDGESDGDGGSSGSNKDGAPGAGDGGSPV